MQPSVFTVTLLLSNAIRMVRLVHDPSWSCPWGGLLFLLFHHRSSSPSLHCFSFFAFYSPTLLLTPLCHDQVSLIYCAFNTFHAPACFLIHAFIYRLMFGTSLILWPFICPSSHCFLCYCVHLCISSPTADRDFNVLHACVFMFISWKTLTLNKEATPATEIHPYKYTHIKSN